MKDSNISWRCTNNKTNCKARIRTDADVKVVLNSMNEHNHDACERKIGAKQYSGQEESFWRYFSQAFEDYQEETSRIQRVSPA